MQGAGDGLQQHADQYYEEQRNQTYRQTRGGKSLVGVDAFFVGETEEGRFHAESQDDQQQGGVGVQVGNDTVAARFGSDFIGVKRHQQVVQEPADDAAKAVNGGLLRERA